MRFMIIGGIIAVVVLIIPIVFLIKNYRENEIDFLLSLNKKLFFFINSSEENKQLSETTINSLIDLKKSLEVSENEEQLSNEFNNLIKNYFRQMLGLDDVFTDGVFKKTLREKIKSPIIRKVLYSLYLKSYKITGTNVLFKLELNEKIDEAISIIHRIKESV